MTEPTYNPNAHRELEQAMRDSSNAEPRQIMRTVNKDKINTIDKVDGSSALKAIREEMKK